MGAEQLFLSEAQVDEFTGIRRGDTINGIKRTKHHLQVAFLRSRGIPFFENARGRAIVTLAAVEGGKEKAPARRSWQPSVVGL